MQHSSYESAIEAKVFGMLNKIFQEKERNSRKPSPKKQSDSMQEIRETTQTLGRELQSMRKMVEDLNLQTNEKDAEIIKLKMDVADRR